MLNPVVDSHGLTPVALERRYPIYWAFTPGLTPRGPLPGSRLPPVGVVTVGIYERVERALRGRLHEHCLWRGRREPLVDR